MRQCLADLDSSRWDTVPRWPGYQVRHCAQLTWTVPGETFYPADSECPDTRWDIVCPDDLECPYTRWDIVCPDDLECPDTRWDCVSRWLRVPWHQVRHCAQLTWTVPGETLCPADLECCDTRRNIEPSWLGMPWHQVGHCAQLTRNKRNSFLYWTDNCYS